MGTPTTLTSPTRRRLALWYVGGVGALGGFPWLSAILSDLSLSDSAIAALLLLNPIGRLIGGPSWSWWADRTGRPVRVLRQATALGVLGGLALAIGQSPTSAALGLLVLAIARAPQFSLVDRLTLSSDDTGGESYGRIRLWGSISFLATAGLGGALRDTWPNAPLWLMLAQLTLAAAASWGLPDQPGVTKMGARLRDVLAHPVLMPLAAVTALHGATISAYDSLITLHIERLGLPSSVAGAALATGVGAEVLVLAASPWLLRRTSPAWLAVVGIASGVPRFALTAVVTTPILLVATQAFHGLGFGLFWVAIVQLAARHAPEGLENSAQAALTSAGFGAGSLLALGTASLVLRQHGTAGVFVAAMCASTVATVLMLMLAPKTYR